MKECFILLNCNFMQYSQLHGADLDSTTGVDAEIRSASLILIMNSIQKNLHKGPDSKVSLQVNEETLLALRGFASNGGYWFNPALVDIGQDDAYSLMKSLDKILGVNSVTQ